MKPTWREWIVPATIALSFAAVSWPGDRSWMLGVAIWVVFALVMVAYAWNAEIAWRGFLSEHERVYGAEGRAKPTRGDMRSEPAWWMVVGGVLTVAGFLGAVVSIVVSPSHIDPRLDLVAPTGELVRAGGSATSVDLVGVGGGIVLMLVGAGLVAFGMSRRNSPAWGTRRALRYAQQAWGARQRAWIAEAVALEPGPDAEWEAAVRGRGIGPRILTAADENDDPFADDPVD